MEKELREEVVSELAGALYYLTLGDYDVAEECLEEALKRTKELRKKFLKE